MEIDAGFNKSNASRHIIHEVYSIQDSLLYWLFYFFITEGIFNGRQKKNIPDTGNMDVPHKVGNTEFQKNRQSRMTLTVFGPSGGAQTHEPRGPKPRVLSTELHPDIRF